MCSEANNETRASKPGKLSWKCYENMIGIPPIIIGTNFKFSNTFASWSVLSVMPMFLGNIFKVSKGNVLIRVHTRF